MLMQSDIYELQAEICKVLANSKRIRIIALLEDTEMAVSDIAKALGISQSNASQHLIIMKSKGVLQSKRVGREILYSIAMPELSRACEFVRRALDQLRGGK